MDAHTYAYMVLNVDTNLDQHMDPDLYPDVDADPYTNLYAV